MANPDIKLMEERAIKLAEWLKNHQNYKQGTPEQQAEYQKKGEAYKFARQAMTGEITVTADKDAPYDFSAKEMIQNIPGSLYQEGQDIAYAITNPGETLGSLGNLIHGAIQKLDPTGITGNDKIQFVNALGQHYAEKYGSFNRFKRELEQNPAGVMADMSMFLSGGAGTVRLGANLTKKGASGLNKGINAVTGETSSRVGKVGKTAMDVENVAKTTQKVAASIDPFNLTLNVPGTILGQTARFTPGLDAKNWGVNLYEKALKPSTTLSQQQRRKVSQTAVDNKIPLTPKGTEILQNRINQLNEKVSNLIDFADSNNTKIPTSYVFKYMDEVKKNVGGFRIEAAEDLAEVAKIESNFQKWIKKIGKDEYITPKELQEFKIDIADKIDWKKSTLRSTPTEEKVFKQMNRGAREGIAETIPEISPLNAELSDLLNLQPILERGVNRIGNRDIFGIGGGIKATGGRAVAGDVGAAVGAGAGVLDFPRVKSGLGIYLNEIIDRKSVV